MARPLTAARQVALAKQLGAQALAHGCTGKGNDQVRFELTYAALAPELRVIAPWREWEFQGREDLIACRSVPSSCSRRSTPSLASTASAAPTSSRTGSWA